MALGRVHSSLVLRFVIAFGIVTVLGVVFDRLLLREGVPRFEMLIASNGLTGLAVAAVFVQTKFRELESRKLLEERLTKLAEMNHHVRNALQVLAFYGARNDSPETTRTIRDAVNRIEWTLEEVLPRGWDLHLGEKAGQPAHGTSSASSEART